MDQNGPIENRENQEVPLEFGRGRSVRRGTGYDREGHMEDRKDKGGQTVVRENREDHMKQGHTEDREARRTYGEVDNQED